MLAIKINSVIPRKYAKINRQRVKHIVHLIVQRVSDQIAYISLQYIQGITHVSTGKRWFPICKRKCCVVASVVQPRRERVMLCFYISSELVSRILIFFTIARENNSFRFFFNKRTMFSIDL